jgi:CHAT domain-containing protein/tetratricopeptide (TPR) repeat protein
MFRRWVQRAREWYAPRCMAAAVLRSLQGDPKAALACAEEAFRHYWWLHDDAGIVEAAACAGHAALALQRPRRALRYARTALRFSRQKGDLDASGLALTLLANVRARQGDYERALIAHREAVALAEKGGDRQDIAGSLGLMGQTLAMAGKYAQAVDHVERALALIPERSTHNDLLFTRAQNLLGSIYRFLGENERSENAFALASERATEIGDALGEWISSVNLGTAQLLQGHVSEGEDALQGNNGPIRDPRNEYVALMSQIRSLMVRGDGPECLRLLEQALALARRLRYRHGEMEALIGLGSLSLAMDDLSVAERRFEEAVRLARQIGSHADAAEAEGWRARVSIAMGDLPTAVAHLEEAIRGTETVRNDLRPAQNFEISIFERHTVAYHDLQWVLVSLGETDRALEIAERGRARALQGMLAARLDRSGAEPMDMARIRATATEQQTTFVVYSLVADPRNFGEDEPAELFIWVVPANPLAPIAFHRSRAPLRLAVDAAPGGESRRPAKHFVRGGDPAFVERELRAMYEVLIAPVADRLPQNEDALVTFVPEGSLLVVPFVALQDEAGRRVIERHTISVSPSVQTRIHAADQRERLQQSQRIGALIVGDPDRSLRFARREANAIAASLKVKPLLGSSATKVAVMPRMPHRRLLHFATHGSFDAESRRLPGALKLAPVDGDDGFLHAEEIASMDLHADLVVLSACSTGQGRIAAEGLLGLSRAFLLAGAPTVIVSLWNIGDDASTTELMRRFYRALRRAHSSPARALRRAMLTTMRHHPEPVDWAAFVVIGSA